ncbi:MAG: type IV pilus twitching motility protein PilT [Elusimicrobia bacterium]|nr:type IV pilus twitching motility protein PilT [Elusimicrobiota bacterium]
MDLQSLLQIMINKTASDLHIRAGGKAFIRVDGDLEAVGDHDLSPAEVEQMMGQIATSRAKKLFAEHQECDFAFQVGDIARFRVNAFKRMGKLSMSIRIIPMTIPTIEGLRLPAATVKKIAENERGLVLVTGITGSGKSSTLAAMIDYINTSRAVHILTIEDPIEFVHKDKKSILSQREIGEDTFDFVQALRMAMRQDPDVILMGEMRDAESVSAAITAAQTGHLVFGTLHTIDAVQTVNRIIDLYPPHQQTLMRIQLAESLKAVISQRLLPCIKGGRAPAVEVMINTAHVKKQIEDNSSQGITQALAKGAFYGMQTFNQSLVKLYKDGMVKEDDVLAAATNPDDVKLAMRGIEQEVRSGG